LAQVLVVEQGHSTLEQQVTADQAAAVIEAVVLQVLGHPDKEIPEALTQQEIPTLRRAVAAPELQEITAQIHPHRVQEELVLHRLLPEVL
jgi:hypothetical protein